MTNRKTLGSRRPCPRLEMRPNRTPAVIQALANWVAIIAEILHIISINWLKTRDIWVLCICGRFLRLSVFAQSMPRLIFMLFIFEANSFTLDLVLIASRVPTLWLCPLLISYSAIVSTIGHRTIRCLAIISHSECNQSVIRLRFLTIDS